MPDPGNPQDYDRFSYARNNPIRYSDPSGHFCYDADKNEFSDGNCFDDMQQQLLDYFIEQLESGTYTDLELMENLINQALLLFSDPVIALRAATEIVRAGIDVPGDWGFEFTRSKFYYADYTDEKFDDSGFGDLADTKIPNQIAHFIGIAYIAAYQEREKFTIIASDTLVWGNEADLGWANKEAVKQDQIDRDLGYIAADLGEALVVNHSEVIGYLGLQEREWSTNTIVGSAMDEIQSYNYAEEHSFTNWWNR